MEETMKVGCSRCGANIEFMPATQKFHCNHCGADSDISEYEKEIITDSDEIQNYDECTCSSCGAKLIVGENTTITVCAYCGSNQIIKNKFVGKFKPDEIIPFQVDQERFINLYQTFIKKKRFAPDEFRFNTKITQIKGLYVPYHVFILDNKTYSRGKGYYESDGRRHDIFFETKYRMKFISPQDASIRLNDDMMTSLEPFDFSDLKKFYPAYLNGYSAENGDEDLNKLEKKAWERSAVEIKKLVNKRLEKYSFCSGKVETTFEQISREYVLLPVWFFSTKYRNKIYNYALNGQTGKVVGKIPLSQSKFIFLIITTIVLALLIVFIFRISSILNLSINFGSNHVLYKR